MFDVKSMFASKTIWGLIASGLGFVAVHLGYTVTDADSAGLVDIVGKVVEVGGLVFAWIGRVNATKVIGKK